MPQESNLNRAGAGSTGSNWESDRLNPNRGQLDRAKEEVGRQGAAALDTIKEGARSLGEEAKERASGYVEGGKHAVTDNLEAFAQAIRKAGDELRQQDQTMAAQLVGQAAGTLERVTRSIEGTSLDDMIGQVRSFARRNPVAFIGGAMLAGFALARFARASGRHEADDRGDAWRADYGRGQDWQGGNERMSPSPYSGSSYAAGERSSFASNTGGSGDVAPGSQSFGGTSTDRPSGPSSSSDASVNTPSSGSGGLNTGSISTGGLSTGSISKGSDT